MLIWRLMRQQYDFIIRVAATRLAVMGLYIFAALESIIIPVPADPLLVATVLAQPKRWGQLALGCTMASVIGGVGGWALGKFFSPYLHDWLAMLPETLAAPAAFAAVEMGFAKFGIFLVFLGAFSPLPYKLLRLAQYWGIWRFTIYYDLDHRSWAPVCNCCSIAKTMETLS